ncbi:Uncharacterized protein QTN25_001261 [Entamoeba marina]
MSDKKESQSNWSGLLDTLSSGVETTTNLFSGEKTNKCEIVRDYKYDNALPTLRYMFDLYAPKYHVSNDTMEARNIAQIHLRYMFTDMSYDRSNFTDEGYENFFIAFNSLFGTQTAETTEKVAPEHKQKRIRRIKKRRNEGDTIQNFSKPIPKAFNPFVEKQSDRMY